MKKISINRETVRLLDDPGLRLVNGGQPAVTALTAYKCWMDTDTCAMTLTETCPCRPRPVVTVPTDTC